MTIVTTGLIADGSSDRALIPLIKLLLKEHLHIDYEEPQLIHCDKNDLSSKVKFAVEKFSPDILFIHRDSENEPWEQREMEIRSSRPIASGCFVISVIPVKMTESWLLTDSNVIRQAAGNPSSTVDLMLPRISKVETCSAKELLFEALRLASELGAQRRRKFRPEQYRQRVAELTSNLTLLRKIPSFLRLEQNLIPVLSQLNTKQ